MKRSIILFISLVLFSTIAVGIGCARWRHRHYDADWITYEIDKKVNKLGLNLTDEQKSKLDGIKGKIVEFTKSRREARKEMLSMFREESAKDVPSFDALIERFKNNSDKRNQDLNGIADILSEFYQGLDDAQKKKVVAAIKEKVDRCEGWDKK
ncbi:MAG: Spy/CpxP family protein refolding chaperone [Nitrospinae bacterium]|nr:Spy/CpxP family protein refolding chaperone [Nitrospinota bacterium]